MFPSDISCPRWLLASLWLLAAAAGLMDVSEFRHAMNGDGMSYLDIADALRRGQSELAVNSYWSPLYPALIAMALAVAQPTPYGEFTVVHALNFLIFLGGLGIAHLFIIEMIRFRRFRTSGQEPSNDGLPDWAWVLLGYSLAIWSALHIVRLRLVTPDLLVTGFCYAAGAILLRLARGGNGWGVWCLLGIALGVGYLAKAVLFLVAGAFLTAAFFSAADRRLAIRGVLLSLVSFTIVCGPWVVALSRSTGRFTFGDSGKLNYAWYVNETSPFAHWQGETPRAGKPVHPPRKISEAPAAFAFSGPFPNVTYPLWFSPGYWYDGLSVFFNLRRQLEIIAVHLESYFSLFTLHQAPWLTACALLYAIGSRRWRDALAGWPLLLPPLCALALYSLVHTEARFFGGFLSLLWCGLFAGVRLPDSAEVRRLAGAVVAVTAVTFLAIAVMTPAALTARSALVWAGGRKPWPHVQAEVAQAIHGRGVRPGDPVAFIGETFNAYWARVARVRIVAEIPIGETAGFWALDAARSSSALEALKNAGARVVVSKNVPKSVPETHWQRLGATEYRAYFFDR